MKKVRVWDLPTRLFHWGLALCIVLLVVSGEVAGDAMQWHFRFGYAALTLVLFRLVWGIVGGHWSRFSSFVPSPATLLAYLKGERSPLQSVGHNPLGALSVLALLAMALVQISAGLMSDDEIATAGPLVSKVSGQMVSLATWMHTGLSKVLLIVLVILHVGAIAWYKVKKGEDLVRPMVTGDKSLALDVEASRDTAGTRIFALAVLAVCASLVGLLLRWAA